jgi:hypothetical protein
VQRASIYTSQYDGVKFLLSICVSSTSFAGSIRHYWSDGMADETEQEPDGIAPANDNESPNGDADIASWERVDRVVLSIARLIGRRIAREQFGALCAANNNRPVAADRSGDQADEE